MRLVLIVVALLGAGSARAEMHCGWFADLTPQNLWPTDRDEGVRPIISARSHLTSAGKPSRSVTRPFVDPRPAGGLGCACLRVATIEQAKRIARIPTGAETPVAVCRGGPRRSPAESD